MGILMKNGRLYSGGGSSSGDAKDIKYDNSNTELESTNIQDAIDEIYENGTGSSAEVELTQAEYDALSEEEKMNGTTYYISDALDEQKVVELTQAEYDALSEEQKMADVNYFITDASNNSYLDIANSLAEVEANESEDKIAGALAVKELKQKIEEKKMNSITITEHLLSSDLKYGKTTEGLLIINGSMVVKANVANGTVLATLPEGYRPSSNKWLIGMCVGSNNAKEPIQVLLTSNGAITIYPTSITQNNSIFIDSAILIN